MKTKKTLSILLAVLTMLSVFGMVSASAAQVPWEKPAEDSVKINYTTVALTYKQVTWAIPADMTDDFYEKLNSNKITYSWEVKDSKGQKLEIVSGSGLSFSVNVQSNKLVLDVMPGKAGRYGETSVTLTIDGVKSNTVRFYLINESEFNAVIAKAEDALKNPDDRYTDDYLENLDYTVKEAKLFVLVSDISQEQVAAKIKDVEDAINGVGVEKKYVLFDAFIDDYIPYDLIVFYWETLFVPLSWLNENVLSQIDWAAAFGGLISAITGLIALGGLGL
ncbi:MAG: hypothetical protein LBQ33_05370 [Oscillospiraceae bacterium]|nr:hypothetical protein [Oscillospiraceae bacterium]